MLFRQCIFKDNEANLENKTTIGIVFSSGLWNSFLVIFYTDLPQRIYDGKKCWLTQNIIYDMKGRRTIMFFSVKYIFSEF